MAVMCKKCKKEFKNKHGLSVHNYWRHSDVKITRRSAKGKELAKQQTDFEFDFPQNETEGAHAGINEKELFAYIFGRVEGIIFAVALEHDIPPKQLATGFTDYFHSTTGR